MSFNKASFYSAKAPVFVLDGVANVDACSSVNKLLSAYTGPGMTLRRSVDNDQLDIQFAGQSLNQGQALDFIGGGVGFVRRWHDQTGGGNHYEQATNANQPLIAFNQAGGYPAIYLNNSGSKTSNMASASNCPFSGNPDHTLMVVNEFENPFFELWSGFMAFGGSALTAGNALFWGRWNNTSDEISLSCTTGVNVYPNTGNNFDPKAHCFIRDSSSGTNQMQTGNTFVLNSVNTARTRTEQTPTTVPSYPASPYFIGHASGASPPTAFRSAHFLSEVICMTDIKTLGQVQTIQNHQTSRYQLPTAPLLFDGLPTALHVGAVSRKLRTAYNGFAFKIRKSIDNTTKNIGFIGAVVDIDAVDTFLGGSNGFIQILYDQSGSGNDMIQTTLAFQPQYVAVGIGGVPSLNYDGTNDNLNTGSTFTFGDLFISAVVNNTNAGVTTGRIIDHDFTNGFWMGKSATLQDEVTSGIKNTTNPFGISRTLTNGTSQVVTMRRSGTDHRFYCSEVTSFASQVSTGTVTSSNDVVIGQDTGFSGASAYDGQMSEHIIYNNDALSLVQLDTIRDDQGSFYSITITP